MSRQLLPFKTKPALVVLAAAAAAVLVGFFAWSALAGPFEYHSEPAAAAATSSLVVNLPPPITHLTTPTPVKGIYITACVAGTPRWRSELAKFVAITELNAVVIDIKDYSGTVSFPDPAFQANVGAGCVVKDLGDFIHTLHQENIYVIGRIAVFQDPLYTKLHPELAVKSRQTGGVWHDRKGLSFVDVGAKPYWDYITTLAKDAYALGFDEINFDYVRYPSDGDMADARYTFTTGTSTKAEMLEGFFKYLHESLAGAGLKTSVDLFGMTTTNTDDLGIGQVLEKALPYFDYVDPMVYPSHWPPGWNGFKNPALDPYQVVKISMGSAVARAVAASTTPEKLRPWLQDFNLGADYTAAMVDDQIKATYDVGLTSWLVWDPGNKYTRNAFKIE